MRSKRQHEEAAAAAIRRAAYDAWRKATQPCKGDWPELDRSRKSFYRWVREAGAALLFTVVFGIAIHQDEAASAVITKPTSASFVAVGEWSAVLGGLGLPSRSVGGNLGVVKAFADEPQLYIEQNKLAAADNNKPQGEKTRRFMRQPMPQSFIWLTLCAFIGSIISTLALCRWTGLLR